MLKDPIELSATLKTLLKILLIITLLYNWLPGISQTKTLSGIINSYAKVTATNGTDNVTVSTTDAAKFAVDDTVLIIQMKGAEYASESNFLQDMKNTGRYEFIAIQLVNSGTGVIKFRSNFLNTYDPAQALQIVRVPYYQSAIVNSQLTCKQWDGSSGGVLAFFVADTLTLNADISATGKGFKGGDATYGSTSCFATSTKNNYYLAATDSAGLKGEGITTTLFPYARGKGAIANAGGGGNGFGAGGGGGSGYNNGGNGGQASFLKCTGGETWGGKGGSSSQAYFAGTLLDTRDRIFMGGGGGSSRGAANGDATSGGNGGGIIFIIAGNLKNNGYTIASNGAGAAAAKNDAGAGGGGGGGSVMLSLNNAIDNLKVEAKGGNGGDADCNGRGGGGGGGFVWFSDRTLTISPLSLNPGNAGGYTLSSCSLIPGINGSLGDSANYLNPVLNGFLFNLIGANQTVCYNTPPIKFSGTKPRGGNGVYAYQWQYRNKSTASKWQNLVGANSLDYQSPGLTDTTDFRRVVTSMQPSTMATVSDSSKWIRIKVKPEIKGLAIAPADTAICAGLSPINIRGSVASGGDGSALIYSWEESLNNSLWGTVSVPPGNQRDYPGTSNLITKYYRRNILNNGCTVTSNSTRITVYPIIKGNKLQPDSIICMGATPHPLRGDSVLIGGAGIYRYQWLRNTIDSVHWAPTSAVDTFATYNPGALNDTFFYKRVVYSGLRNTCTDISYRVKITVLPLVGNNGITQNQTMCENTSPQRFIGTAPIGGANTYKYQWENSGDNATWIPIANSDSLNYKYGVISSAVPLYFRRTVFSGFRDCCKSSSSSIKMTVQPKIQNNIIADGSEICNGQSPQGLSQKSGIVSGGDNTSYAYLWQMKVVNGLWRDSIGANQTSFQPGQLFKTTFFRRKVNSGTCVDFSDSIKINVLDSIKGNIKPGGTHEVCENAEPELFVGPGVTGGEPGVYRYFWDSSNNGASWENIPDANDKDYRSTPLVQNTYFRRIVKSGYNDCCISVGDTFLMKVSKHPSAPEAGATQMLSFKFTTKLHAKPVEIGWGFWTTKNDAITIVFPKDTATTVDNLPFGKNTFYWTIANGSCPTVTDSVLVEIDDLKRFNGFSPNGDNPFFVIEGAENSKVKRLKVFNRWGGEVYSSDNYQNDWDGTTKNGQPLPNDTYFYIFEADGGRIYKGFVVIKR